MNVMAKKSGMQALACGQGCPVTPATGWSGMTRARGGSGAPGASVKAL